MKAKNAKTAFTFNVFLASLAGEPLCIKYMQIANILGVSESTISKLRHGHLRKMPEGLQPDAMASHFAAEIVKSFVPTRSVIARFTAYARNLNHKCIFSDSLGTFVALFTNAAPVEESHVKKFYANMIPKLIERCYEEAYNNSERECNSWIESHKSEKTEEIYQKVCDAVSQGNFDDDKLKQLLNLVYDANLRRHYNNPYSDLSFIKLLNEYVANQVGQLYYNSVRRSEKISISEDSKIIRRAVKAQEQIVSPKPEVFRFTLSQIFYHNARMTPEEIVSAAFENLECTVNDIPLVRYANLHEHNDFTSAEQFVTAANQQDEISGMVSTKLVFAFNIYPENQGELTNVAYQYNSTAPFVPNISCNYSYTLRYPCKFLEHEFVLDAKTRKNWGMRVKLFTLITNNSCVEKTKDAVKSSGTTDARRITFYDWAAPGSGYYRNIYELKYADNPYQENSSN